MDLRNAKFIPSFFRSFWQANSSSRRFGHSPRRHSGVPNALAIPPISVLLFQSNLPDLVHRQSVVRLGKTIDLSDYG